MPAQLAPGLDAPGRLRRGPGEHGRDGCPSTAGWGGRGGMRQTQRGRDAQPPAGGLPGPVLLARPPTAVSPWCVVRVTWRGAWVLRMPLFRSRAIGLGCGPSKGTGGRLGRGGGGGGHVSGSAGTAWPGSPYGSFGALRPPWGGVGSEVITYNYWRCGICDT